MKGHEMKNHPKLPALAAAPTDDTAALTCYALDWREVAIQAEAQRDVLMEALVSVQCAITAGDAKAGDEDIFSASPLTELRAAELNALRNERMLRVIDSAIAKARGGK